MNINDDLVERLKRAAGLSRDGMLTQSWAGMLLEEAATEIKRLRDAYAEIKRLTSA